MPLTRSAARALAASKKGKEEAEQAPAAVQPGQRLYERALQQRERQVLRAAEITAQECTFKPQLATKGARAASKKQQPPPSLKDEEKGQEQQQQEASGSPSTGGGDSPGLEGTTKRFQKLYLDAQSRAAKLESARREQSLALAAEATGKPHITAKAKQLSKEAFMEVEAEQQQAKTPATATAARAPSSALGQRLYEQAQRQREKQAQRAAEILATECPFSPTLVTAAAAAKGEKPGPASTSASALKFVERQEEYQRKVAARLAERQRAEREAREKELSFKPKIVASARAVTPRRRIAPGETVFDHLAKDGKSSSARKGGGKDAAAAAAAVDAPDCTFKPAIPARSASVAKERQQRRCLSLGGPEARGLYERLHADAKLKEERIHKSEAAVAEKELKGCTFYPSIPPKKLPLPPSSPHTATAPAAPRPTPVRGVTAASPAPALDTTGVYARLFAEAKAKQQQQQQQQQQQGQGQGQGPPRSRRLSLGGSAKKPPGTPQAKAPAQQPQQPVTAASPIFERLAQEAQLRREKETEWARRKEQQEMAPCTFAPKVSPSPPSSSTNTNRPSLLQAAAAATAADNDDVKTQEDGDGPSMIESPTESETASVMHFGAAKIFTPLQAPPQPFSAGTAAAAGDE